MIQQSDLLVTSLGECRFPTPLDFDSPSHPQASHFRSDTQRVRVNVLLEDGADKAGPLSFEQAGPRERIFFEPAQSTAAIVTCGGLSPGLNNVIRSVFYELIVDRGLVGRRFRGYWGPSGWLRGETIAGAGEIVVLLAAGFLGMGMFALSQRSMAAW